jgi:hypothetical protein
MRYWFDTEFIEDGKTIDLVSIGIVAEDGRTYYAESSEFEAGKAHPWVTENVLSQLGPSEQRKPRARIRDEVRAFIHARPEFWAYYAAYDWVALAQLFGTMRDLPEGWPGYCRDLKQWCDDLGNPPLPEQTTREHHALNDAWWTRQVWEFLLTRTSPSRSA